MKNGRKYKIEMFELHEYMFNQPWILLFYIRWCYLRFKLKKKTKNLGQLMI